MASANLFISHSHQDAAIADALTEVIDELFEHQVSVSYSSKTDDGGIPTGADWFRWIGEQVAKSKISVVLVTPRFVADPAWLLWEAGAVYGAALGGGDSERPRVRPVGFRVDPAQLPAPLRAANIQMARGDNANEMHKFLRDLIADFEVLSYQKAVAAGERLGELTAKYLQDVDPLLKKPLGEPPSPPRDPATLKALLELTITGVQALSAARMNGRYFYSAVEDGREVLVRHEDIFVESVQMPDEFGLSRVDVERDAETLVICQSYLNRAPIYRVLDAELMEKYPDQIRKHIDPSQTWVLACPVVDGDAKPLGVICIYGVEPPARDDEGARRLRTLATRLSHMFAQALRPSGREVWPGA